MELSNIASVRFKEQINASCLKMQQFCGIEYFVIYLIFKNKEVFVLSNIYSHLSDYYEHQYFTHDHSTSYDTFNDGFYLCENHQGISSQYNEVLTEKHGIHRAYYQMFQTEAFDIVLGAANSLPSQNLNAIYTDTHHDFNTFMVSFIEKNISLFKTQNAELKHSALLSEKSLNKLFFTKTDQPHLAPRESTCLQLTAKGLTSEKIATLLKISKYTVDQYKKNILCKLNAVNMPNAIYISMNSGMLDQKNFLDISNISLDNFRNLSKS